MLAGVFCTVLLANNKYMAKKPSDLIEGDIDRYVEWCRDPNIGILRAQQMMKDLFKSRKVFKKLLEKPIK